MRKVMLTNEAKEMTVIGGMENAFLKDFRLKSLSDVFYVNKSIELDDGWDVKGAYASDGHEFTLPEFILVFLD